MSVDREQIRRDADLELSGESKRSPLSAAHGLAHHCLALLAELKQADAKWTAAEKILSDYAKLADQYQEAEARLAKVPALVEAAKARAVCDCGYIKCRCGGDALIEALAEWKRA